MYRDGVAVCDSVRAHDEEREVQKHENFEITDWISCDEGDENTADKIILLARLDQTYEVPHATTMPARTLAGELQSCHIAERKVGDHYPPDLLPDHQGPYFAHEKAKLVQRDYRDADGTLIAPHELYSKLTEGTLVLLTVSFATYVITNQPGRKDRKVYHVLVDRLKILDHGDGDAWDPPVPALPERRYSPATPKRGRDDAADAAFDSFGSKSSPSPAKKSRRTTTNTGK
ncbi:hypothetical protein K438DRAFT_1791939 [Mycena galopus ATCC 62051]|nr:hypothetical protein K438DRAFT_1791939 [Mycena galopus ATCC 62051]